jgi:GT2 family glycosyltransferase
LPSADSVTAVIPLHNQANLFARLLDSIHRQSTPFAQVVVVDNASTDNSPEIARAANCKVISLPVNTGFAHAVNLGWKAANTPWVAILNSDVELDPDWLEHLLAAAQSAAFGTGTILQASDRNAIDGTYDLLSRAGCAWRAGFGQSAQVLPANTASIAMAPATACIFRRDALEHLGGFDERYGSYLEDVDLGLRCIRLGLTGVYVPRAIACHKGSATLGRWNAKVVRLISRNQLLLISRHFDRKLFRACLWNIIAGQLLWGLVAARHGAFLAWVAGKLDGLRQFSLEAQASPALRNFLDASEREIRIRARDSYWRWYFRLTSTGAAH